MSLCQFKNVFGKPGEGAHSYRFLGTAVVDFAATVALAYATSKIIDGWDFRTALVFWFAVGVAAHIAFCVDTAWTVALRGGKRFSSGSSA